MHKRIIVCLLYLQLQLSNIPSAFAADAIPADSGNIADSNNTNKSIALAPAQGAGSSAVLSDQTYWNSLPSSLDPRIYDGTVPGAHQNNAATCVPDSGTQANAMHVEATAQTHPEFILPKLPSREAADGSKLSSIFPNAEINMQSAAVTPLAGHVEEDMAGANNTASDEPIVIDNDESRTVETTIEYKELPTDEGKTLVKVGAQFPVVVMSEVSSKTAKKGDLIQARLKYDLKIGDRLIASKGSVVNAHINYCLKARCIMHSLLSVERWYRNSGCLGLSFDEIVNEHGDHIPLVAAPARHSLIVRNKGEGRLLGVNHHGQITGPWSQQLRYEALKIGINAALSPAGVFSFGALPVALGVIGAANPSFALFKPVGLNVRHRRLKGFAWGFIDGLPGGWLVQDTVIKGQEAVIKPGDEFLCEFQQEFTGEPATEAEVVAGASTKVHGQIVPHKGKKSKHVASADMPIVLEPAAR